MYIHHFEKYVNLKKCYIFYLLPYIPFPLYEECIWWVVYLVKNDFEDKNLMVFLCELLWASDYLPHVGAEYKYSSYDSILSLLANPSITLKNKWNKAEDIHKYWNKLIKKSI